VTSPFAGFQPPDRVVPVATPFPFGISFYGSELSTETATVSITGVVLPVSFPLATPFPPGQTPVDTPYPAKPPPFPFGYSPTSTDYAMETATATFVSPPVPPVGPVPGGGGGGGIGFEWQPIPKPCYRLDLERVKVAGQGTELAVPPKHIAVMVCPPDYRFPEGVIEGEYRILSHIEAPYEVHYSVKDPGRVEELEAQVARLEAERDYYRTLVEGSDYLPASFPTRFIPSEAAGPAGDVPTQDFTWLVVLAFAGVAIAGAILGYLLTRPHGAGVEISRPPPGR
jgi:hypothetical protein